MLNVDKAVYRLLSDDGLASGTTNMNVDGSGTAVPFYVGPTSGHTWHIARIIFNIEDAIASIGPHLFGGITQLGTGCQLLVQRDGATALDLTSGKKITHNAEFGYFSYDISYQPSGNAAKNSNVQCRFTFSKSGQPLVLNGSRLERLALVVNDDLTDLVAFRAQIQGYEVS